MISAYARGENSNAQNNIGLRYAKTHFLTAPPSNDICIKISLDKVLFVLTQTVSLGEGGGGRGGGGCKEERGYFLYMA